MKISAKNLIINNPDYIALISASFLSSLGTTLSCLAIYHELGAHHASSFHYSVAFALTLLPGLASSHFSEKLLNRIAPIKFMICLEILGASVIALAMHGTRIGSITLLLAALPLGSLSYGFLLPFLNTYTKSRFNDSEFLAVAEVSNILLIMDFILGSLLGTAIINSVGVMSFFVFDILTYLVASFIILSIYVRFPIPFKVAESNLENRSDFCWSRLTQKQRNAFLIYPMLVAACSPCTAILPGAAKNFSDPITLGSITVATPLILMAAKTKGQFLGPLFVRRMRLEESKAPKLLMLGCLLSFLVCYSIVFSSVHLFASFCFVILAHLFSNIVFTFSFIDFRRNFTALEIGPAATFQYQVGLVIMILSCVGVGLLTEKFGNISAVVFGGFGLFFISIVGLLSGAKERKI